MRLWSLHPMYLDPKGLVAVWREGLLAQAVLWERTRGYRRHPQLNRFREADEPRAAIAEYLRHVAAEAERRGYSFDTSRIVTPGGGAALPVTTQQLRYEWKHLIAKLRLRDRAWLKTIRHIADPDPHPLFRTVDGPVADWERALLRKR